MKAYPHHDWKVWKFEHTPRGYWIDLGANFVWETVISPFSPKNARDTVQRYVEDLAAEYGLQSLSDWEDQQLLRERLPLKHLRHFEFFGGLALVLTRLYPNHHWTQKPALIGTYTFHFSRRKSCHNS